MWKGLGQRLKDLAEDLATPPFVDEEDEEAEEHDARGKPQPPPPPPPGGRNHKQQLTPPHGGVADDEEKEELVEVEAGFLFLQNATGRTPAEAAQQSDPHPHQQHYPQPSPAHTAAAPTSSTPAVALSQGERGLDAFPTRRLEEELDLATPAATVPRAVVPPRATLQSSPAPPSVAEPPDAPDPHHLVLSLQEQVSRLEADKQRMADEVNRYQEQVQKSHEETVSYYEKRLSELEAALSRKDEEIASLRRRLDEAEGNAAAEEERLTRERDVESLLRSHQEKLAKEIELLHAEAMEREAAFHRERAEWAKAMAATTAETEHPSSLASGGSPASPPCLEADTENHSLKNQVSELQEEVARLRQALQERNSDRLPSSLADAAQASPLPSQATSGDAAGTRSDDDAVAATTTNTAIAGADASHLAELVAAKDAELQRLREEVERLAASRNDMEQQLNQLSEGYIELDSLLEKERSAHKDYARRQEDELTRSAEKSAHHEAKLAEWEQLLERKEQELRQVAAAATPANASDAPPSPPQAAASHPSPAQVRALEEDEEREDALLARVAQAEQKEEESRQQLLQLQGALERAEATLHEMKERHAEEQQRQRVESEERLAVAEAAWREKMESAVAQAEQNAAARGKVEPDAALSTELDALREENVVLKKSTAKLAAELDELHAESSRAAKEAKEEAAESLGALTRERDSLRSLLEKAEASLRRAQEEREADHNRQEAGSASVASVLQARVRELEEECQRTDDVIAELQRSVVDCLTRNNNAAMGDGAGGSSGGSAELFDVKGSRRYTFSDWILAMVTALDRTAGVARKSGRVQAEWERTYEEARRVNETLNQQANDAWGTIGQLQEEISIKDEAVRSLGDKLRAGEAAMARAEQRIAQLVNEVEALKEDGSTGPSLRETNGLPPSAAAEGGSLPQSQHQAEALALELQAEVESLKLLLHERDDELSVAQRSVENLNAVLESFKASRASDIAERTMDLQLEMDQLRALLDSSTREKEELQRKLAAHTDDLERQLMGKNKDITSLHRKLAELRKALEDAARQLNGENSIDKRVVSHILVNFIHGFVAQKKETDEILKVLSSLLDWDEDMQERVGLLPGPLNPQPPQQQQQQGGRRGLLSWVRGGSTSNSARPASQPSPSINANDTNQRDSTGGGGGLAAMWVDFLMRESEQRAAESEPPPPPPPPSSAAAAGSTKEASVPAAEAQEQPPQPVPTSTPDAVNAA